VPGYSLTGVAPFPQPGYPGGAYPGGWMQPPMYYGNPGCGAVSPYCSRCTN